MSIVVDPIRKFEINGQVCTLRCAALVGTVANNQTVVSSISGDIIRVMGLSAQTQNAAAGSFKLESSGGTALMAPIFAPPLTNGASYELPVIDSGYFETVVSEGLQVDIATQAVNLNVYYINYTP